MKTITRAILGVSALALAAPAFAADAPADNEEQITSDKQVLDAQEADIVVVGATRRGGVDVQDVPIVVNTVTNDDIEKLNLRDFREITAVVPGLQMSSNTNGIGTTSSVRGVNFDVNASGNSGTIEYYLNDAPMTSGPLFQSMYDIGQIEVLRGPQGTLRGRASPSGSITITHRRASLTEVGGYLQGTANDLGGVNVNGALGVPIITDVLGIRVSGLQDYNRGSNVRSINSPIKPRNQTASGRVVVQLKPVDFIDLQGSYQYTDVKSRSFQQAANYNLFNPAAAAPTLSIDPSDRLSIDQTPDKVHSRFEIFTWKATVDLFGQQLQYIGSDVTQKIDVASNDDNANFFATRDFGQTTSARPKGSSMEIRLQNKDRIAGLFDYSVGYFEQTLDTPTSLVRPTPIVLSVNPSNIITINNTNIQRLGASKEESFFGNVTVYVGPNTEISGGVRRIKYNATGALIIGGNQLAAANQNDSFKSTIFSAGVKHKFSDDVMVYASYGSSWRPGISVVGNFSITPTARELQFMKLPPEESDSFELGIKTTWMDRKLTFNASLFRQKFTNYPYRSASGVFYIDNPAPNFFRVSSFNFVSPVPVKVTGVEAELAYRPNDNFSFSTNLAYANGKIDDGLIACNDLNGDGIPDAAGAAPTRAQLEAAYGTERVGACTVNYRSATAPEWSGNFQAEYTNSLTTGTNWYLRGLVSWFGSSENDPANSFDDYGSYALANLFAGVRDPDGAWEVSFFAKNLFNDETILGVQNAPLRTDYQAIQPSGALNFSSNYIGIGGDAGRGMTPPREFGVSLRIGFGSR